jgi:hypothetical protein
MAGGSTALGETDLKASSPALSRRRQKRRFSRQGQASVQTRAAMIEIVHDHHERSSLEVSHL